VDVGGVRRWARSTADAAFAGLTGPAANPVDVQAVAGVLGGELAAFLSVRAGVVAALAAAVGEIAREAGTRFPVTSASLTTAGSPPSAQGGAGFVLEQ
jgi:hypothetical protein